MMMETAVATDENDLHVFAASLLVRLDHLEVQMASRCGIWLVAMMMMMMMILVVVAIAARFVYWKRGRSD
jgi:hypothetical protein